MSNAIIDAVQRPDYMEIIREIRKADYSKHTPIIYEFSHNNYTKSFTNIFGGKWKNQEPGCWTCDLGIIVSVPYFWMGKIRNLPKNSRPFVFMRMEGDWFFFQSK